MPPGCALDEDAVQCKWLLHGDSAGDGERMAGAVLVIILRLSDMDVCYRW